MSKAIGIKRPTYPLGRPTAPFGWHWLGDDCIVGKTGDGTVSVTLLHPARRWEYPGQDMWEVYHDVARRLGDGSETQCLICGMIRKTTRGEFQNFGYHLQAVHKSELAYGHEGKWLKRKAPDATGTATATAAESTEAVFPLFVGGGGAGASLVVSSTPGQSAIATSTDIDTFVSSVMERCRTALARLIANRAWPFSVTEDEAFREAALFIAGVPDAITDQVKFVSRRTITRDVDAIIGEHDKLEAARIAALLVKRSNKGFSCAIDAWTHPGNFAYTGITVYCLNERYDMEEFVAAISPMEVVDHS
jgi:hypothetical protein